MGKADMGRPEDVNPNISPEHSIEDQARQQVGQRQIRVRVDERDVQTIYVSGFRPVAGPEEVILDMGLSQVRPTGKQDEPLELVLEIKHRVILSPYNAKRLAISLGQVVHRYEEEFGEIELNAAKRRKNPR